MKSWNGFYQFSGRTLKTIPLFAVILILLINNAAQSQYRYHSVETDKSESVTTSENEDTLQNDQELPDPRDVMLKSVRLPGWGQVANNQIWKVPIVYGLIGGVAYFSYHTHQQYMDYRAAAYNAVPEHEDEKYGPTPPHIPEGQSLSALQNQRNIYRNRRDLSFLLIVAAYGLNVIDAYVFAHLRDFDVSEDLSANIDMRPVPTPKGKAALEFSLRFSF